MKKYLLVVCSLFILSGGILMGNELFKKDELSILLSKGNINNSLVITVKNISSSDIKIPYNYLKFFTENNVVVCNWIKVLKKDSKELSHKSVMIKFPSEYEDKDCLSLTPNQCYVAEIEDITEYYKKPLINKTVEIYYRGPLGKSNKLEIELE